MTPDQRFMEWLERSVHPFGQVDLSVPGPVLDAVCDECGLVIDTDITGECPQCLAPTDQKEEVAS